MLLSEVHSIYQQIWRIQQWPQDWKRSILIPVPKKGSMKECSNHWTTTLISHASEVMLKILHAGLQHYLNWELPDVQVERWKGRGNRDQIANICWIRDKAREFQKKSTSVSLTSLKPLNMWIIINCRKLLRDGNTRPSYLYLHLGQDETVRTLYGKTDWFRIEKGVWWQGYLRSPCLLNL